jgi:hypothetical protein
VAAETKSGLPRTKSLFLESFSPHGAKTKSEFDVSASCELKDRGIPESSLISPEKVPGPKSGFATLETSEPSVFDREAKPASITPAATVSETSSMTFSSPREREVAVEKKEHDILLFSQTTNEL